MIQNARKNQVLSVVSAITHLIQVITGVLLPRKGNPEQVGTKRFGRVKEKTVLRSSHGNVVMVHGGGRCHGTVSARYLK